MIDASTPSPAPRPKLLLGGRYELVSHIATGGMAQVWEALDTVLHRKVAAKILHPHLATDRAFLLRFQREAIAAARLSHRSIVAIYDTVSSDGYEVIVMELVDGVTLRSVLDDVGRTSVADAKDIGKQVADALDEAHRAGVVHRDIKPSNILLCSDRRVMVTDFGIAKAGEDADLTVTGTLLGTAKYLAPEQVTGDEVDPRTDLYALGVVLYECLAGVAPFRADTDAATALARLHQPPPHVADLNRTVPPELDSIIHRLMAQNPDERPRSAVDLRTALSGVRLESERAAVSVDPTMADQTTWTPLPEEPGTDPNLQLHDDDDDELSFIQSERSWLLPAFVVLLVGTALVLAGVLLNRSPLRRDNTAQAPEVSATSDTTALSNFETVSEPVIVSVASFDPPPGDGTEQDSSLSLAIDGDNETSWRTETYLRDNFGGLKPGVGLIVSFAGPSVMRELDVESPTDNWSATIYVSDTIPDTLDGWGAPVAQIDNENGSTSLDLDSPVGSHLLLWVTNPGTTKIEGQLTHRFVVDEILVN
ncbi:MAG: serine/threonine-protein kinase [Acidimicrobiales bacterium]